MITINYIGEFGNKMFQYAFARLLAEANKDDNKSAKIVFFM